LACWILFGIQGIQFVEATVPEASQRKPPFGKPLSPRLFLSDNTAFLTPLRMTSLPAQIQADKLKERSQTIFTKSETHDINDRGRQVGDKTISLEDR